MMMNSADATADATVVKSAPRNVSNMIGTVAQRLYIDSGAKKIMMKLMQAPARKSPNIQDEARRMRSRILLTSAGKATVSQR